MFQEIIARSLAIAALVKAGQYWQAIEAGLDFALWMVRQKQTNNVMAASPEERAAVEAALAELTGLDAGNVGALAPGELLATIRAVTELVRLFIG